ncbi:acid protease [Westerdykella ornata]|uniref:Acid protease n=1 Tax=Westerdykella ornata TaxID=318751 RepID=A0A6A6JM91_WESOR|nr:acid protease [Westerdykella ornata]KAF2277627.1 acid protease [Westerdykella ornata]
MRIARRETGAAVPTPYVVPPSKEFDGNDGAWSTFKISVGTPGQDFRVLASTQSGATQVVMPEGCLEGDGVDCPSTRGAEVFNSEKSPGFQLNVSSTWSTIGQYDVETESRLNITVPAIFGYDKVALGPAADRSSLSLDHQVVAGVADLNYYMGHIPLGTQDSSFSSLSQSIDSFLYQLRNQTKIPSLSFAYTAGAKYRLKSVFGSLILGGYDSTRFTPNPNPFSFSFSADPSRLLTVGVESLLASNSLKGTYSLSSSAHFSLLDSTVPHLWLPRPICDNFEQAFGLTYDPTTDLYLVNSSIHAELRSKNPSITIKLVNSLTDTSTNYTNIVLPYAAFDLQASYPYYSSPTNYFPIRRAANESQYVLGRTLLQEAYLIVDYERANFTIAQAAFPDPLPAANIVTIHSPSDPSSSSEKDASPLGTAAIAGIAAGGGLLLILIIVGAVFLHRRRRSRRYELANTQITETAGTGRRRRDNASADAHKHSDEEPQELGGAPFIELASPRYDGSGFGAAAGAAAGGTRGAGTETDYKSKLEPINVVPQELPTPHTPRWVEVRNPYMVRHEMDGESSVVDGGSTWGASREHSRDPSADGREGAGWRNDGEGVQRAPVRRWV